MANCTKTWNDAAVADLVWSMNSPDYYSLVLMCSWSASLISCITSGSVSATAITLANQDMRPQSTSAPTRSTPRS